MIWAHRSQWTLTDGTTVRVDDSVLVGNALWLGRIVGSTISGLPIVLLRTGPGAGWRMELDLTKLRKLVAQWPRSSH